MADEGIARDHPRDRGSLAGVLAGPVGVGLATWVWAQLSISQAACSRGAPIPGSFYAGAGCLVALGLLAGGWLGHRQGLGLPTRAGLALASLVLSGCFCALALAVWELGHHCAS